MLGYTAKDLQSMTEAVDTALLLVDDTNDPWLHGNLAMTKEFLEGLWAEGYFD